MNLSGIRISAGFYDYNSIENQTVTVGSELPAELPQSVTGQAPSTEEYTAPAAIRKSGPDQGAIDYANSYQPDAVYELKGVDSDIARLDVPFRICVRIRYSSSISFLWERILTRHSRSDRMRILYYRIMSGWDCIHMCMQSFLCNRKLCSYYTKTL